MSPTTKGAAKIMFKANDEKYLLEELIREAIPRAKNIAKGYEKPIK